MNDFDKTFVITFNNSFLKVKLNCDKEKTLILKVHQCRFENFTVCSGSYESNTLKISHS